MGNVMQLTQEAHRKIAAREHEDIPRLAEADTLTKSTKEQ
jgi:hypothetical protein